MRENGYQVIARRWRPKQFDELVGQDHIVRTLSNAIESQRIAHAYYSLGRVVLVRRVRLALCKILKRGGWTDDPS